MLSLVVLEMHTVILKVTQKRGNRNSLYDLLIFYVINIIQVGSETLIVCDTFCKRSSVCNQDSFTDYETVTLIHKLTEFYHFYCFLSEKTSSLFSVFFFLFRKISRFCLFKDWRVRGEWILYRHRNWKAGARVQIRLYSVVFTFILMPLRQAWNYFFNFPAAGG